MQVPQPFEEEKWSKDSLTLSPVKPSQKTNINNNDRLMTENKVINRLYQNPVDYIYTQRSNKKNHHGEYCLPDDPQLDFNGEGDILLSDGDNNDLDHLIFDIEEVECKMTDMEERERSDESKHFGGSKVLETEIRNDNLSVRGSILNSPKNY
jgi:hypothetical protein